MDLTGPGMNPLEGVPLLMLIFFGLVIICVAVGFAFVIVALLRSRRSARLAEIERLHQGGQISTEERTQARQRILGSG